MTRYLWRLAAVVGLVLAVLPFAAAPADAQALPDGSFDCSTPTLCLVTGADEAAYYGVSINQVIENWVPVWEDVQIAIGALLTGEDYGREQCLSDMPTTICDHLYPLAAWDYEDALGMTEDQLRAFCLVWPGFEGCALLPEVLPGDEAWIAENGSVLGAPDYSGTTWGLQTFGSTAMLAVVVVKPEDFTGCSSTGSTGTYSPMDRCWIIATPEVVNHSNGADGNVGMGMYGYLDGGFLKIGLATKEAGAGYYGVATADDAASVALGIYLDNDNMFKGMWTSLGSTSSFTTVVNSGGSGFSTIRSGLNSATMGANAGQVPTYSVRVWRDFDYNTDGNIDVALREILDTFDPEAGWVAPSSPEDPFVDPRTDVPGHLEPDPAPTPTDNTDVTVSGDTEKGWLETLGNRIGGFFNGLGDVVSSGFQWLGDQVWAVGQFIVDALGELLARIYDALRTIAELLGSMLLAIWSAITAGFNAMASFLAFILDALANLPGLILDGLGNLFIPEAIDLDALADSCATAFPCSWIQEVVDATGEFSGVITGSGSCTTPAFDTGQGGVLSLPAPDGCSGGNGAQDGDAGDLFGFRVMIRSVFLVALMGGAILGVLRLTPWGFQSPIEPQAVDIG